MRQTNEKRDIMKQRIALWMLCMVLMLIACAAAAQESTDNILIEMEAANTREALAANNERAAYRVDFSYNDGTALTIRNYMDKEKYVYEEDGYLEVDKDGKVAVYFAEPQVYSAMLFVGDTYEENLQYRPGAWYQYEPTEEIVQIAGENGKLLIDAAITDENTLRAHELEYGYAENEVKRILMHYVADAASYEIDRLVTMAEKADGSTKVSMEVTREADAQEYVIPDGLAEILSCEETRSITLIENPGTDQEKADTYQVPRGFMCQLALPMEYDQMLYADAAFEKAFESHGDYISDVVGYIRK